MEMYHRSRLSAHRSERGSVVYLIAMLASFMIGLCALVIDLSRQEVNISEIQTAADAAAHAMAVHLDGTQLGWQRAKRAGMRVLREYSVLAGPDTLDVQVSPSAHLGPIQSRRDPWETDSNYIYSVAERGNVTVAFERGAIIDGVNSARAFKSWEGESIVYDHRPYHLAHAARVEVRVSGLRNVFARIFGMDHSPDLTGIGLAVHDQFEDEGFAPFALPACQMRYDPDGIKQLPDGSYARTYAYEDPNKEGQCYREMTFTETKYAVAERIWGLTRYQSYQPYIVVNFPDVGYPQLSNRLLLLGAFGTFSDTEECDVSIDETDDMKDASTADELLQYLESGTGGTKAIKFGSCFKPIIWGSKASCDRLAAAGVTQDDCSKAEGPLDSAYADRISSELQKVFDSSASTYQSQFGSCSPEMVNYEKNNCPDFLTYPWPMIYRRESGGLGWTWMSGHLPDTFTNPLCHDQAGRATTFPNSPTQKVKHVRIALVAPAAIDPNTNKPKYKYCQWSEGDGELTSILPHTKPQVVGSVEGILLDFNLLALNDASLNPPDKNPAGWLPYIPPGCDRMPQEVINIVIQALAANYGITIPNLSAAQVCDFLGVTNPGDSQYLSTGEPPLRDPRCEVTRLDRFGNPLPGHNAANLPNVHCTPVWSYPDQAPSFAEVWPLPAQQGCGGVLARLSCADETIPGQNARGHEQPMILTGIERDPN